MSSATGMAALCSGGGRSGEGLATSAAVAFNRSGAAVRARVFVDGMALEYGDALASRVRRRRTGGVTHILDALGSDSQLGRREEFAALLARADRALFAFIFALAPNRNEAEELLQETRVVLWEKFDDFAPGTNFLSWAYSVARLEVLKYRERRARHRRLFSTAAVEAVSGEIRASDDEVERRHAALQHCLGKLNARQGQLLRDRYQAGMSVDQLAARLGRSCDAVYQTLSRIRRGLYECIERSLAAGGRS